MAETKHSPIDLVFPWVDGSDPAWQAEKAAFTQKSGGDARSIRYRDWDTLKYLFRGIEQNLPWIRTVHFITWGHLPSWLNTECEKLHVVNHRDYIPAQYLPTFSSHTIELNMHRIEGLSERFIYANDDMFFLRPLPAEFFFRDGLPVDRAAQNVLQFRRRDGIDHIVANNLTVINTDFSKRDCIRRAPAKWLTPKYGAKALKNLYLMGVSNFTGFEDYHIPYAYLKSTLLEVWEREYTWLDATCSHRVRCNEDVNQWLFRYWQLASGRFYPGSAVPGALFAIGPDDEKIEDVITHRKLPMCCLSDDDEQLDFEKENARLCGWFSQILPEKSAFEK
ncbi:MAG: Stealth CR1 domain-containing protein [Clostridia bacterium]|nr:Stealth CR1 domain-containing protein [Clostridia bacterium]